MNTPAAPDAFAQALVAVQNIIDFTGNRGLIIGGVAVSLLAKPRYTADIDALLLYETTDVARLVEHAATIGLVPRTSDPVGFAEETRVLPLQHTASQINIDISFGVMPFEEEAVERSMLYQTDDFTVRLPSIEDLIILKAVAHRPKDLIDVESLLQTHPNRDDARINRWVKEFADFLEAPELWDDYNTLRKAAQTSDTAASTGKRRRKK